ncbi:FecR domain-containing protein [Pseudomonas sp. BBP2017]|uniref:FecR family protein n=1 Tax=Pseudomonas sp. BBP2017 TaxID=2109731 RepID=UPI000D139668|nr:FecR domain-containing protein [Pseudomonas sp. BBP2017]PSS58192.1 iron dicitrate transport regulator FecR [Pseudomonas sp. BBP2017]
MNKSSSAQALQEAAEWLVRLEGDVGAAERNAFRVWLAADPEHMKAIERLQSSLTALRDVPDEPAQAVLDQMARRRVRRQPIKALALVALLLLPLGVALQQFPPSYLLADIHTSSAQRSTLPLDDGSRISLDGSSAVDLQFDGQGRTVRLVQGEIRLEVAKDATRPFRVLTGYGSVHAHSGRFFVEQLPDASHVAVIESTAEVDSAGKRVMVEAGQALRFDAAGPGVAQRIDAAELEQAWERHQLLVRDQSLDQVLEQLARNHHGYLLFDARALQLLRVTGVLPADDSQRALRVLARSLPIKIEHYSPWVTRVSLEQP